MQNLTISYVWSQIIEVLLYWGKFAYLKKFYAEYFCEWIFLKRGNYPDVVVIENILHFKLNTSPINNMHW